MGREIRRVPAGWEHPQGRNGYQPLYDNDFETVAREWLDNAIAWDNGTHEDAVEHKADHLFFWQWGGEPPNAEYYRPKWTDAERTHYQIYETVSEGTPVTPPFATKDELVDYLVKNGTFWDDGRGWSRKAAEQFVEREWAPSLIIVAGKIYEPRDGDPL